MPSLVQLRAEPAMQPVTGSEPPTSGEQVAVPLHTLPSSGHFVLSGALRQPEAGTHESVVQDLPSLQLRAVPAMQPVASVPAPASHTSVPLHRFVSAQRLLTFVYTQAPVAGLQESVVHECPSSQGGGAVPGLQMPVGPPPLRSHVSTPLQALLSEQLASMVHVEPQPEAVQAPLMQSELL
jgi:hypothetical protein